MYYKNIQHRLYCQYLHYNLKIDLPMRSVFLLMVFCLLYSHLFSQNSSGLDEVKDDIYYDRIAEAKQKLLDLLNDNESHSDAYYILSELFLEEPKLDSAEWVIEQGIQNAENLGLKRKLYSNLLISRAHLKLEKGLLLEARQEMEAILKENKYRKIADIIAVAKAHIVSKNGDLTWAIEILEKAKAKESKNTDILLLLGDAYRKSILGGQAIANFDRVNSLQPQLAEPLFKKGMIYKTQGNPEIYLDLFQKAFQVDSNYAPVLYQLYDYYFLRDASLAEHYLKKYIDHSDYNPKHDYMLADVKYNARKYNEAISIAKEILAKEGLNAQPRLYKLISYSYLELGDSLQAFQNINTYFDKQVPTDLLAKDFELKAVLTENVDGDKSGSIKWYKKALQLDSTGKDSVGYMIKLANLEKQLGDREEEAYWRGQIFRSKIKPTNLDLYEWGVSLYFSKAYPTADSVFSIYEEKYPEQLYGYLWRARSNAAIDTSMMLGLAVPHYNKFIELAAIDSVKNKSLLLQAYQYMGAYEANVTKNYLASKEYFTKVLMLKPSDPDADKSIKLLEKLIQEANVENDK